MDVALLLARVLLTGVFGLAAVTNLVDLPGSARSMHNIGLPRRLAIAIGIAMPVAELAVAVAFIPRAWAWWGALGAAALLLMFVVGIAVNLVRGRTPDSRFPGQLRSAPAGWTSLARTSALAAVAAFILWQGRDDPGRSMVAWAGGLSVVEAVALGAGLLALALVAAVAWLTVQLLRQSGRLLIRIEILEEAGSQGGQIAGAPELRTDAPKSSVPVGSSAPAFSLPGLDGEPVTLERLRVGGKPVVLVFTDPACGSCRALMPEIGLWQREHARDLTLALISRGTREANAAHAREHRVTRVLLQRDREVANAYQAVPTPSAVLVQPDGSIGSSVASGSEAVRSLVQRVTNRRAPLRPTTLNGHGAAPAWPISKVGQSAPAVMLSNISGETVRLQEFQGERTLVLFWNPECGFCNQMLGDLRAWEADPPLGAPRLLVISTGTVEANRKMALRAPVLLDQGFGAGRTFGAAGTPSAVLIDAEGIIASEVAVGAPAVLALAGTNARHVGSAP